MNNIRTVSRAADHIAEMMRRALERHGTCIVGLSGGKTPKAVYEKLRDILCQAPHPDPLPRGEGIQFFLVDERYVPADHLESNQRLVRKTLLKERYVPPPPPSQRGRGRGRGFFLVSEKHFIFPNISLPLAECVADYERRLRGPWKDRRPDLIILGMGTDGHVASLFPPLTDLALGDGHLVLHTRAPEGIGPPAARDRITLSLNALCSAEHRLLLLGPEKKRTWEEMMASPEDERRWPLKRIIATGNLTVMGPATATA